MNKPIKILVYFTIVNSFLFLLSLVIPTDGWEIGSFTFKFPSYKSLTETREVVHLNESSIDGEKLAQLVTADSVLLANTDSIESVYSNYDVVRIEHPNGFENAMATFYRNIKHIRKGETVRVLHFGDSQIEGDRISGVLRRKMQESFGGCGIGLFPVTEAHFDRRNVKTKASENWERHSVVKAKGKNQKYGVLGNYHSAHDGEAWLNVKKNERSYLNNQKFESIKVFYDDESGQMKIELMNDSGSIALDSIDDELPYKKWKVNGFENQQFKFSFDLKDKDRIYGVSLECDSGVLVDNIAMRGSSGAEFLKMDEELMRKQFQSLNVGLIIYQFGVNVIPHITDDYRYYRRLMERQLALLKKIAPNSSILVVSVSDMCNKEGEEFTSYPNVLTIRDIQRETAFKMGCSFWDLLEEMGGENSMAEWIFAKPRSLAEQDCIHFNARGARIIGDKLAAAILNDYLNFTEFEIN